MTKADVVKLDKVTADDFRLHLETDFYVAAPPVEQPLSLRLVEVTAFEDQGPRSKPFSLVFSGAPGLYLPQQIYTLRHDTMGALNIFLVPIQPDERGARLQAIFN